MSYQVREALVERVRYGMRLRGMRQVDLAKRSGIPTSTISRMLSGSQTGRILTWQILIDTVEARSL